MNIIELAKEADIYVAHLNKRMTDKEIRLAFLERFAALVRAPLQAKIDRLMLEYCPGEMSDEQTAEWGMHQSPADMRWVDLTDDELGTAMMPIEPTGKDYFLRLGRAVIAKFKEKNK